MRGIRFLVAIVVLLGLGIVATFAYVLARPTLGPDLLADLPEGYEVGEVFALDCGTGQVHICSRSYEVIHTGTDADLAAELERIGQVGAVVNSETGRTLVTVTLERDDGPYELAARGAMVLMVLFLATLLVLIASTILSQNGTRVG